MRKPMPAHRRKVLPILAAAAFLCTLSVAPVRAGSTDKVEVYVVNYPLRYFAGRIAGDSATIVFPAPSGEDPAFWTPGVDTVKAFQGADLILLNGAGYARWVKKVSLPRAKMVDTSKGFEDRFISSEEITTHSHGPGGKHAHESLAFTTWLDFELAARQARAVADALGRTVPGKKDEFNRNYAALKEDLQALDRQIGEFVVGKESRPLIASHPVYQYLTRRYGLNVRSVHWEPDEAPDLDQWSELKEPGAVDDLGGRAAARGHRGTRKKRRAEPRLRSLREGPRRRRFSLRHEREHRQSEGRLSIRRGQMYCSDMIPGMRLKKNRSVPIS